MKEANDGEGGVELREINSLGMITFKCTVNTVNGERILSIDEQGFKLIRVEIEHEVVEGFYPLTCIKNWKAVKGGILNFTHNNNPGFTVYFFFRSKDACSLRVTVFWKLPPRSCNQVIIYNDPTDIFLDHKEDILQIKTTEEKVLDIHNTLLRIINKKLEAMKLEKEKEKEKLKDQDKDKEKENKEKPADEKNEKQEKEIIDKATATLGEWRKTFAFWKKNN